ncbi:unnamed protein product [Tetraodon nigroviridis]|uniref:(spotted green pufferfish) hypothetical protein n=1 Tax=Tetraodon nigroviridis TaxID=99883 RepID=Q4TBW2_TETNG|nr:unnamed protein product [Tetraodon nigroviridis]
MAAPLAPPSVLREFCPLYYLRNAIPSKVQRGFRSVVVYLTALDSSCDFLAVGSSIGMLYLYCRRLAHMNKYSLEGRSDAITAVKLLSCFDDLVAVGTASGRVAVFQLVSPLPGRNKQLRRFDVVGLHKGSITSLTWSTNGMKLFSGDDKGRVVFSSLDLDQGVCNPVLLLEEPSGVVQMEYSHQVLLVSTQQRSLLYCTQKEEVQQLGTKPRKSSGRFGACFLPGLCKQSDLEVFAARPNLRLWRSNIQGQVEDTHLLKSLFQTQVPHFELFPLPGPTGAYRPPERQLGLLQCFLQDGWILSWNEYSVYVFDYLAEKTPARASPSHTGTLKADSSVQLTFLAVREEGSLHAPVSHVMIGVLESGGDIVSVSCCDNEIFILKGDRDIIRLSNSPEGFTNLTELSLRLTSHSATPTIPQSAGLVETAQPIRTLAIKLEDGVLEQGGEGCEMQSKEKAVETAEEQLEGVHVEETLSSLVTSTYDPTNGSPPVTTPNKETSRHYSSLRGQEELQQELVVTAIKVKKRIRRQQGKRTLRLLDRTERIQAADHLLWPVCQESLFLQSLEEEQKPKDSSDSASEVVPVTPDVDLLLQCSFSYMHRGAECDDQEQIPEERFLNSTGPEDEEEVHFLATYRSVSVDSSLLSSVVVERVACLCEQDGDEAPAADQMFYSTVSSLDKRASLSSDEDEDIYCQTGRDVSICAPNKTDKTSERHLAPDVLNRSSHKSDQLAESWMGYSGPGCGILNLQVTDRHVWCLDFRGGLFCTTLPDTGLSWQRFDNSVHQVAVSPSGHLLWKVEQKSMTAFACAKVSVKGKRHWYKAVEQAAFVALSDDSAWIIRTNGDLYLQTGTFWQNVVPRGTVSATKWTFITSSAVPHREGSFLWLAQSRKDLFCVWDQDGQLRPSSVPLPPDMELTQLAACCDALWGLDSHGRVSIRTLSPSCPFGLHWAPLDLSQLGNVRLVSVSCGSQNVWAVDHRGVVYFRVGTQPLNPSMMLPAWIHIEPPAQPVGVQLVGLQTSSNDQFLWAVDNRGTVFVRTGLSEEMPVGTGWEMVPGLAVSQLVISSRTVWVRCVNGDLARRYGVTDRNPAGDYWKKIPGHAHCLTGDGGMRVGPQYQAMVPEFDPVDEYISVAKEKHGYNMEQALGMLFWHKHNINKSLADLPNFTPFPDEWTVEDKVLFEQAFSFHGKSFHRIQQMATVEKIPVGVSAARLRPGSVLLMPAMLDRNSEAPGKRRGRGPSSSGQGASAQLGAKSLSGNGGSYWEEGSSGLSSDEEHGE